jgi:hypothetical protein
MRIVVDTSVGDLAGRPEAALEALSHAAACDGASREDWLSKAAKAATGLPVNLDPSYRIVKDVTVAAMKAYRASMAHATKRVAARLTEAVEAVDGASAYEGVGVIRKAHSPHLLTADVIRDVVAIIAEHHGAVAAAVWGPDVTSEEDWKLALALGLVDPGDSVEAIAEALHTFGAMLAHMDLAAKTSRYGMSLESFKAEVRKNPVPQTRAEYRAAEYNKRSGAQAIVGLGNKKGATLGSSLIEADRALDIKFRGLIRDVVSAQAGDGEAADRIRDHGVAQGLKPDFFDDQYRSTVKRMVSDLGHATNDWARDFQRIAHTESNNAIHEGQKESWLQQEHDIAQEAGRPPKKIVAFKLPRPDACRHCQSLHTDGGNPRLFYLSDLEGHGNNVGKRTGSWQAVVGSTHPWCGCPLHKVPAILDMPRGWRSGQSAPEVIGAGGQVVIP